MIIPIPAIWGRHRTASTRDQIDHAVDQRSQRLVAGLAIEPDFEEIQGALIVTVGNGKFARLRHCFETSLPIPKPIRKLCLEISQGLEKKQSDFAAAIADLADVQSQVLEKLKLEAGKYVDRILAVAVTDPGLWAADFDGRVTYASFCDGARLAELSGISVIDNFPAADLAAGGNGNTLAPLPLWLLAADRAERVALLERFVLDCRKGCELYRLPPSDGLDAELPPIEVWTWNGKSLIQSEVSTLNSGHSKKTNTGLNSIAIPSMDWGAIAKGVALKLREVNSEFKRELIPIVHPDSEEKSIGPLRSTLTSIEIRPIDQLGFTVRAASAVIAAMLGVLHIHQMPANIPALTGAHSQRILGRLSLGRASSFRQLIRVMSDHQPAAMKLKDAI